MMLRDIESGCIWRALDAGLHFCLHRKSKRPDRAAASHNYSIKWLICLALPALAACSHTQPAVEIRTVQVPTPVPCLPADEIPAMPPTIADQLTGLWFHDGPIIAASALELRAVAKDMHAALVACADSPDGR